MTKMMMTTMTMNEFKFVLENLKIKKTKVEKAIYFEVLVKYENE